MRHFEFDCFSNLCFHLNFVCMQESKNKEERKTKIRQGNCKVCRVNYEVPRSTFRLLSLSISSSDTCDYIGIFLSMGKYCPRSYLSVARLEFIPIHCHYRTDDTDLEQE